MVANNNVPRGIRNKNPGNIRRSKDPWQGLAERQTDRDFFVFKDAVYGIRALARTLISYQDKYQLRSIRQIAARWAPPIENDTPAYAQSIVKNTGFGIDQFLNLHCFDDLRPLVESIIHHENGQQPYTDAQITKALVLAGVEPIKPTLQKSRTVKGGQTATAATIGVGIVDAVQTTIDPAREALTGIAPYLDTAKWLLLAITLIGIGVMLWARIDDHRKGLR